MNSENRSFIVSMDKPCSRNNDKKDVSWITAAFFRVLPTELQYSQRIIIVIPIA